MSSIAAQTYLTPEEYIAAERKATLKSEYLSGKIVAMSGASNEHNLITMNTSLFHRIRSKLSIISVKINSGYSANFAHLRTCYPSFQLEQNSR